LTALELDSTPPGAAVDVVLAVRAEWLRARVEKALASLETVRTVHRFPNVNVVLRAGAWTQPDILVVAVDEHDDVPGDELEGPLRRGLPVLALVDEDAVDLAVLARFRGAGFLSTSGITPNAIRAAFMRIRAGEPPVPQRLIHRLMTASRLAEDTNRAPRLTRREQEALVLLVEGLSNKELARRMLISPHGAKRLVGNILAKLDCPNRTMAVARAIREGIYDQCLETIHAAPDLSARSDT
jgi:DNA-binding NarL/FixJ family response regulator